MDPILYGHYGSQRRDTLRNFIGKMCRWICPCCRKKRPAAQFVLDHCHKTDTVRGAICRKCNNGLGMLGDTELGLIDARIYLQNPVPQAILRLVAPFKHANYGCNGEVRDHVFSKIEEGITNIRGTDWPLCNDLDEIYRQFPKCKAEREKDAREALANYLR